MGLGRPRARGDAAQEAFEERQRVPMMRVMTHQPLPVIRVEPFHEVQRNRFYRPY